MIPFLVVAGIVSLVIAFGWGYAAGKAHRTPTTTLGINDPQTSACSAACLQWDSRRTDRCNAEADEVAARGRADALRTSLGIVLLALGGLIAAGVTAAAIGLYGWIAAAVIFTAAGILAATAAYLTGLLSAAEDDVTQHQQISHTARTREGEARDLVLARCTLTEAAACFNLSPPCMPR